MEIIKISDKNPWWQNKKYIYEDEKISMFESATIKFYPELQIKAKNIYVIRGPRQVGKTTFLKLKIKELLEKGIEPKSLMFYSCDLFRRPEQISDMLETYAKWCEPQGITPHTIFLDEITAAADWARAIKYIKNSNIIRDAAIVVTGSNSLDLKQGAEKLPGRGIEGNEYFYFPICFRLFCKLMGKKLPAPINANEFLEKEANKEFIKMLYTLALDKELRRLFNIYLKTGGFLLAINNQQLNVPYPYETYIRWIEGDLTYFRKDVRFAKQILSAVNSKNASQVSINSISKITEIASPVTAKEYLSVFEDMQMLLPLYKYDISKKELDYKKEKKYHFVDPLMYSLVSQWTETKMASEEAVIEATAASHVYRHAYVNKMGIGFYNDGKYEVDIMLMNNNKFIPLEVKWSEKIGSQEWRGLYKFGRGILLTKNDVGFEKGRYLKVPLPVFLSLLDIPALVPVKYT